MFSLLVAALIGAPAVAVPTVPQTGTGFVEVVQSEFRQFTWFVGGLGSGNDAATATTPFGCTGTCVATFGQTLRVRPNGPNAGSRFVVTPEFTFSAPDVQATARQICLGCEPRGFTYVTDWGPVAFSMTGKLTVRDVLDPTAVSIIDIVGTGSATAASYYEVQVGPWNYATMRWNFSYTVVPEPATLWLVATGLLMLGVGGARGRWGRDRGRVA